MFFVVVARDKERGREKMIFLFQLKGILPEMGR